MHTQCGGEDTSKRKSTTYHCTLTRPSTSICLLQEDRSPAPPRFATCAPPCTVQLPAFSTHQSQRSCQQCVLCSSRGCDCDSGRWDLTDEQKRMISAQARRMEEGFENNAKKFVYVEHTRASLRMMQKSSAISPLLTPVACYRKYATVVSLAMLPGGIERLHHSGVERLSSDAL